MAAPNLSGFAAQVAALQTRMTELESRMAKVDGQVAALVESDIASGWAQWRENQKQSRQPDSA